MLYFILGWSLSSIYSCWSLTWAENQSFKLVPGSVPPNARSSYFLIVYGVFKTSINCFQVRAIMLYIVKALASDPSFGLVLVVMISFVEWLFVGLI